VGLATTRPAAAYRDGNASPGPVDKQAACLCRASVGSGCQPGPERC